MLPSLLERTDVVLDLRDARLPLTGVSYAECTWQSGAWYYTVACVVEFSNCTVTFQFYDAMQTSPSPFYPRSTWVT